MYRLVSDGSYPTGIRGIDLMPSKLAAALAVLAVFCILLSTVFGVSHLSDWLLDAAEGLFIIAIIIFGGYVILGIIGDAGTV
jgi:hypothetical protein